MIAAIVLVALIALAVVAAVAWPLVVGGGEEAVAVADPARVALDDEIAASMRAIRDLQFDHEAGNLSDEDFAELERAERANAARLLRRRSALDAGS
jgi:hypothetical protein